MVLQIVADENMPLVSDFFEDIGQVHVVAGRSMTATEVKNADVLLVRSVTQVDANLLSGSRVRFVGTATIGFDHIDKPYLKANKIGFACAPGCNANSVVEYVFSALTTLSEKTGVDWRHQTVGIVGVGHVGALLKDRLQKLGVACICNDPPRAAKGEEGFVELDELIAQADVISIHTPLTQTGDHPTHHLFNKARLAQLKPQAVLINTARGGVVDNDALLELLNHRHDVQAVLDVWENEPDINTELLNKTALATPHIAGYSLDGKMKGTEMIYKAVCRHFGFPARKKMGQFAPDALLEKLSFSSQATTDEALAMAIRACYDVRRDDAALRAAVCRHGYAMGQAFDDLRKHYPVRREFFNTKIKIKHGKTDVVDVFKALGFMVRAD